MDGWVDGLVDGGLGGLENAGSQAKPASFCVPDPRLDAVDRQTALAPGGPTPIPLTASPPYHHHQRPFPGLPEKSHLLVLLLIVTDDLGGGDAHLHAVHHKLACPLEGLIVQPRVLAGADHQAKLSITATNPRATQRVQPTALLAPEPQPRPGRRRLSIVPLLPQAFQWGERALSV